MTAWIDLTSRPPSYALTMNSATDGVASGERAAIWRNRVANATFVPHLGLACVHGNSVFVPQMDTEDVVDCSHPVWFANHVKERRGRPTRNAECWPNKDKRHQKVSLLTSFVDFASGMPSQRQLTAPVNHEPQP